MALTLAFANSGNGKGAARARTRDWFFPSDAGGLSAIKSFEFDTFLRLIAKLSENDMVLLEKNIAALLSADTISGSFQPVYGGSPMRLIRPMRPGSFTMSKFLKLELRFEIGLCIPASQAAAF